MSANWRDNRHAEDGMGFAGFAPDRPVKHPAHHRSIVNERKLEMTDGSPIMKFFAFSHLPERLQEVSRPFHDTAFWMEEHLPNGPEKSAGLRKLLEAKDCAVRAAL